MSPQIQISLGKSKIELLSNIKSLPIINLGGNAAISHSPIYKFPSTISPSGSSVNELPSQLNEP